MNGPTQIPWGEWRSLVAEMVSLMVRFAEGQDIHMYRPRSLGVLRMHFLLQAQSSANQREMMAYAHREHGWDFAWWARAYDEVIRWVRKVEEVPDLMSFHALFMGRDKVVELRNTSSHNAIHLWAMADEEMLTLLKTFTGRDMETWFPSTWCRNRELQRRVMTEGLSALDEHEPPRRRRRWVHPHVAQG